MAPGCRAVFQKRSVLLPAFGGLFVAEVSFGILHFPLDRLAFALGSEPVEGGVVDDFVAAFEEGDPGIFVGLAEEGRLIAEEGVGARGSSFGFPGFVEVLDPGILEFFGSGDDGVPGMEGVGEGDAARATVMDAVVDVKFDVFCLVQPG